MLAPALLLVWLYRALGWASSCGGRRDRGCYTPAELARLDDQGLAGAAATCRPGPGTATSRRRQTSPGPGQLLHVALFVPTPRR
ncbi:hypothetical protein [Streptomyces sp. NPDC007205]|uniref:hypothetical protein n=1 Tax=Streptomyces sp. NPDC007205 TaxID=3154316 RepID=UPI00340328BD